MNELNSKQISSKRHQENLAHKCWNTDQIEFFTWFGFIFKVDSKLSNEIILQFKVKKSFRGRGY